MPTVHLLIKGKVQGVFFRSTAQDIAEELHLTGWIKNTESGDVEATVTGEQKAVEKFIAWCRKGPRKAEVTDVIITPKEETSFQNFSITR